MWIICRERRKRRGGADEAALERRVDVEARPQPAVAVGSQSEPTSCLHRRPRLKARMNLLPRLRRLHLPAGAG